MSDNIYLVGLNAYGMIFIQLVQKPRFMRLRFLSPSIPCKLNKQSLKTRLKIKVSILTEINVFKTIWLAFWESDHHPGQLHPVSSSS